MEIIPTRTPDVIISPVETASQQQVKEKRELIQAVRAINAQDTFGSDNELTFFFDRNSHKAVVRIVNKETREVVRQIPNESVLRIAQEILAA
ncbi:MAG: flagellar protein FlaG [Bryobacteraceae bacterium]